jgi:preprotein translocase SecE subunit
MSTTIRNEKAMASNIVASTADEPDDDGQETPPDNTPALRTDSGQKYSGQSFFSIYKKGQGKWTRLGTIFVAALLGILTAFNLYAYIIPYLPASVGNSRSAHQIVLAGCVGFLGLFALLVFRITNKPKNVDFLIATDSEMKKVNWTTQGELIGSTRVVILFLVFIAIFLSLVDLIFAEFFQWIGVLLKA